MDWVAERKRIEDAANTIRNLLDGTRLQVRSLEEEMHRLEGEYRLIARLAAAEPPKEVNPDATSGDGGEAFGRPDPKSDVGSLRDF